MYPADAHWQHAPYPLRQVLAMSLVAHAAIRPEIPPREPFCPSLRRFLANLERGIFFRYGSKTVAQAASHNLKLR